ncbi:QacE family quaternary ammonium compound efflux SMR transporter [Paenibacillus elgii]|uniref:QacE family quaternary ammonium compound efflux SMR transporter n=1 Tax=Paenibacillus elgii TaxID=189691 RepID=A0A2T6FU44_9BACL|nr:multidrug efflux SMR transporter [Paenibacillus elgii]PUA35409.1 QacE family quaternary ammonium compound efflux SMR transporter [Paenibacillus elgii]
MYWLYLGAAIALEIAGTISMKFSQGFTRLTPSILMVVFYLLAFTSLNFSLKQIDVSVAYAIWSGLGTAVIAVIGYLYFNESMSLLKAGSIVLIILGVIGLNLGGGAHGSSAGAQSESTPASKQKAQD